MSTPVLDVLALILVAVLTFGPAVALWWFSYRRGKRAFAEEDSPYPRRRRDLVLGRTFRAAVIPALGFLVGAVGRATRRNDMDETGAWEIGLFLCGALLVFCILPFCLGVRNGYRRASEEYGRTNP